MIVFIAGMPRSGSTFSFNIVRCLLEARGALYQEPTGNSLAAIQAAGEATHVLFKGHAADEITVRLVQLGAIKAVCTVRKPEDAIASWMTAFGFTLEQSLSVMEAWLQMFSAIRRHALIVPFDQIDRDPKSAAWKIAAYVCDDVDQVAIERIADEFTKSKVRDHCEEVEARKGQIQDLGFSYYDMRTFFHRKHVSSIETIDAADRIGIDQVLTIRNVLGPRCDERGNLV